MALIPAQKGLPSNASPFDPTEILFFSTSPLGRILGWSAVASAVGLLLLAMVGFCQRRRRWPAMALATVLLGCPGSCVLGVFHHPAAAIGPWGIDQTLTLADGREYILCHKYAKDCGTFAVCRMVEETFIQTRLEVLDTTGGDHPGYGSYTSFDGEHSERAVFFGELKLHESGDMLMLGLCNTGVAYFDLHREQFRTTAPEDSLTNQPRALPGGGTQVTGSSHLR